MVDKQNISQILDYWFAVEFLGQDSYESCTDETRLARELNKYKKAEALEKKRRKQISVFEKIDEEQEIRSMILKQAKSCEMSVWGNLTFYIGKIKRQTCIEKLAERLGILVEQGEKNSDYIPILSFQCSNHGDMWNIPFPYQRLCGHCLRYRAESRRRFQNCFRK